MLFGVPTMYHRIAGEVGSDAGLAEALRGARVTITSRPASLRRS